MLFLLCWPGLEGVGEPESASMGTLLFCELVSAALAEASSLQSSSSIYRIAAEHIDVPLSGSLNKCALTRK